MSPSVRKVWIEMKLYDVDPTGSSSPSVRKVWIEIEMGGSERNDSSGSPSVRKVWIEMVLKTESKSVRRVTFRKEGVD